MGLFDKIKNKFDDLIYEDGEDIKEDKKEEKKEEKPQEKKIDDSSVITERDLFKTDPKFTFPINFDDEDLEEEEEQNKKVNALKEQEDKYKLVEKKTIIEEKKVFRPSPAISPVYGILDKNYKKEDVKEKTSASGFDVNGKLDVDSVIKKAYGEVEVTKTVTREEKFYAPETPVEKDTEINLFESLKEEKPLESPLSRVELNESEYEEESYDIDEIDDKIKSIDKLLKETNDDDFYSLVDSMYKDEEEEEEE